jgi:hypothetical protein
MNVFPAIVYADVEPVTRNKVTTVWSGLEVKACRFPSGQSWWRKMQSLGLSNQYGKKDSGMSILEENIRTVAFTTGGSLRLFALEFLSNLPNDKRVEQSYDYLLENYIDSDSSFPPPVWSECTASSLRTINACELFILCPLQCIILQCAS